MNVGNVFTSPTGDESRPAYRLGDWLAADHVLEVPLDHQDRGRGTTTVYAREVRAQAEPDRDRPYLLFLQGGPGGKSPRPNGGPEWLTWAVEHYRVLLLDQRGTGRSTPLDPAVITGLGSVQQQADHLALFRADSIVADAEVLRHRLLGDGSWATLGQSFGGFCTFTYLSFAPEALTRCYVTGGIPPLSVGVDDVYRSTYAAIRRRIDDLDREHPDVRDQLRRVATYLAEHEVRLPTGIPLTVRRLQEVGHVLGQSDGPTRLRFLLEEAWAGEGLSEAFLAGVESLVGAYTEAPLYALIHEACYLGAGEASRWSAERVRPEFAWVDQPDGPLGLTGEAIYPDTVSGTSGLDALAEVADVLAERVWDRPLYDLDALSRNTVPVAAQVYQQDMYVTAELSRATAALVPGVHIVEDAEHHHDALRVDGHPVLAGLHAALGGDPAAGP